MKTHFSRDAFFIFLNFVFFFKIFLKNGYLPKTPKLAKKTWRLSWHNNPYIFCYETNLEKIKNASLEKSPLYKINLTTYLSVAYIITSLHGKFSVKYKKLNSKKNVVLLHKWRKTAIKWPVWPLENIHDPQISTQRSHNMNITLA